MNKQSTLAIIAISTGLLVSTSSYAFDLYAETDSTTPVNISTPDPSTSKKIKPTKNKQTATRAEGNMQKKQRHELRKERIEKHHEQRQALRKERMEKRHAQFKEARKERLEARNQDHKDHMERHHEQDSTNKTAK